jgi:hypothetical protein
MERSENTRKSSQILWGIGGLIAIFGLIQVIRGESTEGFSGLTAGFTVILTAVYIRLRDIQLRQTEVLERSNVIHQGSLEVQRKLASLQEETQALLTRDREPTPVLDSAGLERASTMPGFKVHAFVGNPGKVQILPRRYDVKLVTQDGVLLAEAGERYVLNSLNKRQALAIQPYESKPMQFPISSKAARQDTWPSYCLVKFSYASGGMTKEIEWRLAELKSATNSNIRDFSLIQVESRIQDGGFGSEKIRIERFDKDGSPMP